MKESRVLGTRELRGVMLPAGRRSLLLPIVAVAEVIAYVDPRPADGMPEWLMGRVDWRGRQVPVIAWERAVGEGDPDLDARRVRIAVLNTLNGNPALPYVALVTAGISRLARISAASLALDAAVPDASPWVLEAITAAGQPAWIPDLDAIERLVLEALPG